jgi:hypothetical protein
LRPHPHRTTADAFRHGLHTAAVHRAASRRPHRHKRAGLPPRPGRCTVALAIASASAVVSNCAPGALCNSTDRVIVNVRDDHHSPDCCSCGIAPRPLQTTA